MEINNKSVKGLSDQMYFYLLNNKNIINYLILILITLIAVRSKYMLLPLVTVFNQLFLKEVYKTDNELRGRILGMIEARPGIHYSWIKVQLGKGNGVCAYHLNKLERDGIITSKRDKSFKRYYPKEAVMIENGKPYLTDPQQQIKEILEEHPGASQKEIGYLLDESKAKINYHIKLMERKGIIRMERDRKGHTSCYLVRETKHIPPPKKKGKKVRDRSQ